MGFIFWKSVIAGGDVGGRATDLGQIAISLVQAVNGQYGGEKRVPSHVRARLQCVSYKLDQAETELLAFAKYMFQETTGEH